MRAKRRGIMPKKENKEKEENQPFKQIIFTFFNKIEILFRK